MRRALFLDRDGTIIEDGGYLADPDGVRLVPGACAALRAFRARGWRLVVISNQSGIARGLISRDAHARVHARTAEVLAAEGIALDGAYYCDHGPDDGCACRKPAPGMLRSAARDLGIDLTGSWMVGDKPSDVAAGKAAGCEAALLGAGACPGADVVAPDWETLLEALASRLP